jgi:hypothetical protein
MIFDFLSLVLQAAGGGILGTNEAALANTGLAVIKAGLGAHLAAIGIFVALAAEFGFRTYRNPGQWDSTFSNLQQSRKFISFLIGNSSFLHVPCLERVSN